MFEAARVTNAILVVRLGAMGDVLHALPGAASLKLSFPDRKLAWVVDRKWAPLLAGNPHIDRVICVERNSPSAWLDARREMRRWRYGIAVDFQGLIKSAAIARMAGAKRLYGFDQAQVREGLASMFYTDRISSAALHRVDRGLDLAGAAGARIITKESAIPPGKPEGELPDGPYVLASPFAGWGSKQWPLEWFDELGAVLQREAGLQLVLNCSPRERDALEGERHAALHTSGIDGLIDATRRAAAVIGVDSGPMHLAAALGKPGVAIFGPTDPAINGPYGGTLAVLRDPGAVTTYKRERAIAESMRRVVPAQVWAALRAVLAKARV